MTSARSLHFPASDLVDGNDPLHLTAERARWTYAGLRVIKLEPGETRTIPTGAYEMAILPLSGGGLSVSCDGELFSLHGRTSVFSRVTDFVYVPSRSDIVLVSGEGAEVALCMAKAESALPPRYGAAEDVKISTVGAGPATRQVNSFFLPGEWDHAERLMCREILTPDGNWSSYPPTKQDDSPECAVQNEVICYHRTGEPGTVEYAPAGFGMARNYGKDLDQNVAISDGDVTLVHRGYYGPEMAAPGYNLYTLVVAAGAETGKDRSIEAVVDPDHAWVRDSWSVMPRDPRCPMTGVSE